MKLFNLLLFAFLFSLTASSQDMCDLAVQCQEDVLNSSSIYMAENKLNGGATYINGFKELPNSGVAGNISYIKYYRKNYPNNAFILESELHKIVDQYDMVFAHSTEHIGEIPKLNIAELEDFDRNVFKSRDRYDLYASVSNSNNWSGSGNIKYDGGNDANSLSMIYDHVNIGGYYIMSERKNFNIDYDKVTWGRDGILELTISGNYSWKDERRIKESGGKVSPPDPIIFRKVKGGYIVVTRWLPSACYNRA